MKLSAKGIFQALNAVTVEEHKEVTIKKMDAIEFDQDDFEGAVVLTVEEAKEIQDQLAQCSHYIEHDFITSMNDKMIDKLEERIEQAEKNNA